MRIQIDREKCSGCHLCEMVCSLHHLGVINVERSAIRIQKRDLEDSLHTPVLCRQCQEMKCLNGEEGSEHSARKEFLWDRARADRCPFNALSVMGNEAYHCDVCGGDPQCVKVCTPGAIRRT